MKKNPVLIGALLITCLGFFLFFYIFKEMLPGKTPREIARIASKIELPSDIQLLKFEEKDFARKGSFVFIVFALDELQFEKIKRECRKKGYQSFVNLNFIDDEINPFSDDIKQKLEEEKVREGYFLLKTDPFREITVLETGKRELFVYKKR